MKTSVTTTIIRNLYITAILAVLMGLTMTSCSSSDSDDFTSPTGSAGTITEARVTFTYTVPQDLFKYAEITVARNNNAGTDAQWGPMLDATHTETYDITKFAVTAPVVMIYDLTNRPAYGVNVEWDITMDVEAILTIDGKKEVRTHNEVYHISGDLGCALDALMKNVLDRTYAVKINKHGDIQFVH